jgi:predicted RNA binding protein YcfA (HicA-like mRNA interferase family)
MPNCDKLLEKARRAPTNLRFTEVCQLAECYGFAFERQRGSHVQYLRPGYPKRLTLQPDKHGKAKPYQVRQVLDIIDELTKQGGL